VLKGNNIVIWGAGNFGTKLYQYISSTNICNVVAWTDTRYLEIKQNELQIDDPKVALRKEFDYIVLAILNANMRENVLINLLQEGIPRNKISDIDVKLLTMGTLEEFFNDLSQR
jgi:hypothetical protein